MSAPLNERPILGIVLLLMSHELVKCVLAHQCDLNHLSTSDP